VLRLMAFLGTVFLSAVFGTWLSIRLAKAKEYLDHPNAIKIHVIPVPRLGGIGIFCGLLSGFTFLFWEASAPDRSILIVSLTALLTVLIAGVVDDVYTLSPRWKLAGLAIGALILAVWFAPPLIAPGVLGGALSFLTIIGMANAMNLIDGIDGLAGSIALIAFIFFAVLFQVSEAGLAAGLAAAGTAATTGFLLFNRHPARTFMGDSGSLLLGTLLGFLLIRAAHLSWTHIWSGLLICIVPIWDTAAAIVRRLRGHGSIFEGDRCHSYDLLYERTQSYALTISGMIGTAILCGLAGLAVLFGSSIIFQVIVTFLLLGLLLIASLWLGVFVPEKLQSDKHSRAQEAKLRQS